MGEQLVPEQIGKEVGVAADLRKGHPNPREAKSQKAQYLSGQGPEENKGLKLKMQDKVRSED